jgi:gamma-glutamyltranspeptidase/glutathione hydrolase
MVMLAEFGTMTLAQVLEPAMQMADGYPIEEACGIAVREARAFFERDASLEQVYFVCFSQEILQAYLGLS